MAIEIMWQRVPYAGLRELDQLRCCGAIALDAVHSLARSIWSGMFSTHTYSNPSHYPTRSFDVLSWNMTVVDPHLEQLWALLSELSSQLSANREHCALLQRQAEDLKVGTDSPRHLRPTC